MVCPAQSAPVSWSQPRRPTPTCRCCAQSPAGATRRIPVRSGATHRRVRPLPAISPGERRRLTYGSSWDGGVTRRPGRRCRAIVSLREPGSRMNRAAISASGELRVGAPAWGRRVTLAVPDGSRFSQMESWRRAPTRVSGPGLVKALDRAADLEGLWVRAAGCSRCQRTGSPRWPGTGRRAQPRRCRHWPNPPYGDAACAPTALSPSAPQPAEHLARPRTVTDR